MLVLLFDMKYRYICYMARKIAEHDAIYWEGIYTLSGQELEILAVSPPHTPRSLIADSLVPAEVIVTQTSHTSGSRRGASHPAPHTPRHTYL